MPKDRERTVNPATAQRKAEKQKALKKGKAAVAAQRTERLAHRNPDRLQRQIDDLKALEQSAGKLSSRDQRVLEELERDVARVRQAKKTVGEKGGERTAVSQRGGKDDARDGRQCGRLGGSGGGGGWGEGRGILGKRGRDRRQEREHSDTDESVRNIPMPRDTPPPIPFHRQPHHRHRHPTESTHASNANAIPLGDGRGGGGERGPHPLPEKPATNTAAPVMTQTIYEAKPMVRDLRKEAVSKFVPAAVQRKLDARNGVGGQLLEEDDLEMLEKEGYGVPGRLAAGVGSEGPGDDDDGGGGGGSAVRDVLKEEEERFEKELANGGN